MSPNGGQPDNGTGSSEREGWILPELFEELGLTTEEYETIVEILGREPNKVELGHVLGDVVRALQLQELEGAAREAAHGGAADTGRARRERRRGGHRRRHGGRCSSSESHNHPSAVEPFQGAATGVGGIVRDIFTMGARPIAGPGPAEVRLAGEPRAPVTCSRAWWRGSPPTATAWAYPPWRATSTSRRLTRRTRSST